MRNSILALGAVFMIAGCGSGGGPKLDGGVDMTSMEDFATPDDLTSTMTLGCAAVIQCTNAATTQAAFTKCINMATPMGKQLFNALIQCLQQKCPNSLGADGGTTPCSSASACNSCVQTGTSPTGMTSLAGASCSADGTNPISGTDPKCGLCVDQLNACGNNM